MFTTSAGTAPPGYMTCPAVPDGVRRHHCLRQTTIDDPVGYTAGYTRPPSRRIARSNSLAGLAAGPEAACQMPGCLPPRWASLAAGAAVGRGLPARARPPLLMSRPCPQRFLPAENRTCPLGLLCKSPLAFRDSPGTRSLLGTLEGSLEKFSENPHVRGRQFERVCRWYLLNDPAYSLMLTDAQGGVVVG